MLRFLLYLSLLLPVLSFGLGAAPLPRPNILFVIIDDLNTWVTPFHRDRYGKPRIEAPELERLAARGITFQSAHTAEPFCEPSRTMMLVGQQSLGGFPDGYDEDENRYKGNLPTLPRFLSAGGYHTVEVGKVFHNDNHDDHWDQTADISKRAEEHSNYYLDFAPPLPDKTDIEDWRGRWRKPWGESYIAEQDMVDRRINDYAIDFLNGYRGDEPFFLAVGYHLPHTPWLLPPRYARRCASPPPGRPPFVPLVFESDINDIPYAKSQTGAVALGSERSYFRIITENDKWAESLCFHKQSTRFSLDLLGELLAALDASDFAKNTFILVTSDHGWLLGEKMAWGKGQLWESSTRVPLLLAGPRRFLPHGEVVETPVSLMDVYPTTSLLAGLEPPAHLTGKPLVKPRKPRPQARFRPVRDKDRVVLTSHQGRYAERSDQRRRIYGQDGELQEEYDLEADPMELCNLAFDGMSSPRTKCSALE